MLSPQNIIEECGAGDLVNDGTAFGEQGEERVSVYRAQDTKTTGADFVKPFQWGFESDRLDVSGFDFVQLSQTGLAGLRRERAKKSAQLIRGANLHRILVSSPPVT